MNAKIACHSCDLLVDITDLSDGQSATCPRCDGFLTRYQTDACSRVVAFSSAALILLILSNAYPFLSFSASGLESVMSLPEIPGALWSYGMPGVGAIVAAFIIFIPALVLVLLLAVCLCLSNDQDAAWLKPAAKGIFLAQNWAMVEVFIIGVIVALVKIASMATVGMGVSFWAYIAFTICFLLAVSSLDRYQCWEKIEELSAT